MYLHIVFGILTYPDMMYNNLTTHTSTLECTLSTCTVEAFTSSDLSVVFFPDYKVCFD